MRTILLLGFLLLAMVAGAQDQIKTQAGKIYTGTVTDADAVFLYYKGEDSVLNRVPINSLKMAFIADTNKVSALVIKSPTFKAFHESQVKAGYQGTASSDFAELLSEAGAGFESGSRKALTGIGITLAGGFIGGLVSYAQPIPGLIITGASALIGTILQISGYSTNIDASRKLRQAADAAAGQQLESK
ncbi:hypothetical protein [Microcystis phage Mae-Yong924-2]|nr:hypothetical protein [Microcystis phage Mea-Yong924-1]QYC50715.1 hypothetical protein [Microcystis phage Mae-Yong924-2]